MTSPVTLIIYSYEAALLLNTFLALGLAFFVFKSPYNRCSRWVGWIMVASAWWSLTNLGELLAHTLAVRIFWSKLHYLGAVSVPVLMLLFVLEYCNQTRWLTRRFLPLYWIVPVITLILVWTNEWHNLIWDGFTPQLAGNVVIMLYDHGPAYWVMISYFYGCVLAAIGLLIRLAWQQQSIYRRQAFFLILIILLPWLGEIVYNARLLPGLDFTVFGLTLAGLLLAWNFGYFNMLNLMPIAIDRVFAEMQYAVMVLDSQERLVNFNPAAEKILNLSAAAIGRPLAGNLLTGFAPSVRQAVQFEVDWPGPPPRLLEVTASPMADNRNQVIGHLIMCHDITEYRQSQEKLWLRQLDVALLEERQVVSRKLHQETRQVFQEVATLAHNATRLLEDDQPAAVSVMLARMGETIYNADADIDQFVQQNRYRNGSVPSAQDFFKILAEFIDYFSQTRNLPVIFTYPNLPASRLLTSPAQIQLLWVIQQALATPQQSSPTAPMQIIISHSEGWVQTVITQLGEHTLSPLLQQRINSVGGSIELRTVPGYDGRHWIIQLPRCRQPVQPHSFADMRVLLVDDHYVLLEGFKDLLEHRGFQVVGTASTGTQAVELTRQLHPNLVLMDIRMPGMSGIEATRQIKTQLPEVKVVILTVSLDREDLFAALRNGADGYLLKTLNVDEFFDLLGGVLNGNILVAPDLAKELIVDIARVEDYEQRLLTGQQLDVLRLVARGATYRQIGEQLSLSEHTVRYHIEQIRSKLGATNRAEAIARAIQIGLIESPS